MWQNSQIVSGGIYQPIWQLDFQVPFLLADVARGQLPGTNDKSLCHILKEN